MRRINTNKPISINDVTKLRHIESLIRYKNNDQLKILLEIGLFERLKGAKHVEI